MMAEFGNQTVVGLISVRELALRHKRARATRKAKGLSHHEWGFYGFCFHTLFSQFLIKSLVDGLGEEVVDVLRQSFEQLALAGYDCLVVTYGRTCLCLTG